MPILRKYTYATDLNHYWKKDEIYQRFLANFYETQKNLKLQQQKERIEQEREWKRQQAEQKKVQDRIAKNRKIFTNSLSVKKLGWINCDRFSSFPDAKFVQSDFIIDSSKPTTASLYVIFSSIKSVLPYYSESLNLFKFNMKVPENEKVTIVAIGSDTESTFFGMKEVVLGANSQEKIFLKPVTIQQLKAELILMRIRG